MNRLALFLLLFFSCADASAANRFLTCNTTCTITASDTTIWGTTTGGTGASVPGSSDAVVLDGATSVGGTTCTATMGSGYNPTWQSITMGACTASTTGCIFDWSVNNNNVTLTATGGFNGSGSGTRNLKMGNGIWTLTGVATSWTMTTTTNLTFNANSSTITFTATGTNTRTFNGGGLTYNALSISANTSGGAVSIPSTNTFGAITVTGPNALSLGGGTTQTITTLSFNGASGLEVYVFSGTLASSATLSVASNAPTITWVGLRDITGSGGATFTATNSFGLGNNSGITITAPQAGGGGIISGANDNWALPQDKLDEAA